jgi:hypothetical protein
VVPHDENSNTVFAFYFLKTIGQIYRAITFSGKTFQSFLICLDGFLLEPNPPSLATTNGVSVDVLSFSYLDVSVR